MGNKSSLTSKISKHESFADVRSKREAGKNGREISFNYPPKGEAWDVCGINHKYVPVSPNLYPC